MSDIMLFRRASSSYKKGNKIWANSFPYANNMSFPELKIITSVPLKYAPLF